MADDVKDLEDQNIDGNDDKKAADDKAADDAKAADDKAADDKSTEGEADDTKSKDEDKDKSKDEDKDADKDKSEDKDKDKSKDDDKDKSEESGAPDEYTDFDVPEGMEINDELNASFKEFSKTNNLPQKTAQELVDMHSSVVEQILESQQDRWDELKAEWKETVAADKTLFGDTGKSDAAVALSLRAVESLGGKDLMDALQLTGAGDHPAVIKVFHKIGLSMSEDEFISGAGAKGDERSREERLYPTMFGKKKK